MFIFFPVSLAIGIIEGSSQYKPLCILLGVNFLNPISVQYVSQSQAYGILSFDEKVTGVENLFTRVISCAYMSILFVGMHHDYKPLISSFYVIFQLPDW